MKKDPWDFITEIGFRKSGPELRAFNQQLDSIVVGNFFPGEAPTVLDPNKFPDATEAHEHIHQELTMATTFGGLFTILATLTKVGHFEAESVFCLNQQWAAQEGCATYAGMATIAQSDPDKLPDAIERLPSLNAKDWPYREIFQFVSRQLPVVPESGRPRLKSQIMTVLALGHCSLNSDCLIRFKDPGSLTYATLEEYFREHSPNRRFREILNSLGHDAIEGFVRETEAGLGEKGRNPVRDIIHKVAALLPRLPIVAGLDQIKAQHRTFCEGWASRIQELTGEALTITPGRPKHTGIAAPKVDMPITRLSLEGLHNLLGQCRASSCGIWAVISMRDTDLLQLDVFPYAMDQDKNPASEMDTLRDFMKRSFCSGSFRLEDVLALLREFPGFPQAVLFVNASWYFWKEAGGDALNLGQSVQVNFERALREESVPLHLHFHNLGTAAEYFLISYDELQAAACLSDPRRPGIYALQYLAGRTGLGSFRGRVSDANLREMKSPESQVLHLPLLRLMVFPAFLAADPDAGDLLTPIFKLLHSAKLLDSSAKVSGDAESQTGRKKRGHKSA